MAVEWMAGGLYRDKQRTNFYNNYTTLRPTNAICPVRHRLLQPITRSSGYHSEPTGVCRFCPELRRDRENEHRATCNSAPSISRLEVTGGVRIEHTDQGYAMKFPIGEDQPDRQSGLYRCAAESAFPVSARRAQTNWRLSYFRSLNRPGFLRDRTVSDCQRRIPGARQPEPETRHCRQHRPALRVFPAPIRAVYGWGLFYKKIQRPH